MDTILVGTFTILGAFFVLAVSIAFFVEKDALSRLNALGPATALGLPLIMVGAFIFWVYDQGFSFGLLAKAVGTIAAMILVSSVASNLLARAAYMSGAPLDERTSPNDLTRRSTEE